MDRRPIAIYLGALFLAYLGIVFIDCGLTDRGNVGHILVRIVAPVVELGLAYSLASWVLQGDNHRWARSITAFTIATAIGSIYISQSLTLHLSDNFVTVLALENAAEGRLVRGPSFYTAISVGVAWTLCFAWLYWRARSTPRRDSLQRWPLYTTLALLLPFAWLVRHQENHGRLEVNYREVPVSSMLHVAAKLYRAHASYDGGRRESEIVDTAALSKGRYPFEKNDIYHHDLPFPKADGAPRTNPNVIVIFTEGFSARIVGEYGGKFANLTPHIDQLAARAMRVDNYFNHTAATYRGLQGQLVSGYPEAGGYGSGTWETDAGSLSHIRYQSLPLMLRDVGYQSYFFSPHPNTVALNDLLRSLGFDKVFTLEDALPHSKEYATRLLAGSLSDKDLFTEMIGYLKQRTASNEHRPMFLGMYDIGTHAFLDVTPDGAKYGDGTNQVLNRFHNYDQELGRFLDYFFSSPYANDTILIFTADHATFPEPAFRAVAGDHYKPYFVDRVPLIIYDPFHKLPPSYDAQGRTSLTLAPTVMQLLGIKTGLNSFIGRSLFSKHKQRFGMNAQGPEFFATDSTGVYDEHEIPAPYREEFAKRKEVIQLYYQLERENRIFKAIQ